MRSQESILLVFLIGAFAILGEVGLSSVSRIADIGYAQSQDINCLAENQFYVLSRYPSSPVLKFVTPTVLPRSNRAHFPPWRCTIESRRETCPKESGDIVLLDGNAPFFETTMQLYSYSCYELLHTERFHVRTTLRPSSHALGIRHFVYFVSTVS